MKTADLTSNQFYGGLNRRFQNRCATLKRIGYTYTRIDSGPVFLRSRYDLKSAISVALVMHADRRVFRDELKLRARRCVAF